jgi:hypothetical protein
MMMANGDKHIFRLLGKLLTAEDRDIISAALMVMKNHKFNVPLPKSFYAILKKLVPNQDMTIENWAKAVLEMNMEASM